MSTAAAAQVRSVVEPPLVLAGFHLEDVVVRQAGSRRLVQVLVDRDDPISLDAVAEASRIASTALDSADVFPAAYVLEVSSPGVDRPLTQPRHWRRNAGRLVTVTPVEGSAWTGRVTDVDEAGAVLEVDGAQRRVAYDAVRRAVVQVEFNRAGGGQLAGEEGDT